MIEDLRILVADDDPQMQLALKASLTRRGAEVLVVSSGRAALDAVLAESFDVIVTDQRMPEMSGQELLAELEQRQVDIPLIMITAYGTINQAVEAMQLGAADFITKPFSSEELERTIERVITPEHRELRQPQTRNNPKQRRAIITNDGLMIRMIEVAEAVARSDATVLVQGESGTGKELVARLVHSSSPRHSQPFVAVNCAALPANLLESELFGHEKGAFTGAQNRKLGKFELAQGGTILLDEISEMDLPLQAKLLRVLQEREVDRVGGKQPISIDVRVIATTNRNLAEFVQQGRFRSDLYYRLNVVPITLPPLRDRRGDIILLIQHFMRHYLGETAPAVPESVLNRLIEYPWPGNIRELQNAVERAAILSQGKAPREADFLLQPLDNTIGHRPLAEQIEKSIIIQEPLDSDDNPLLIRSGLTVQEMERLLIEETLKATENNRTRAAELLGISIRTLRNKLNEYRRVDSEDSAAQ